MPTVSCELDFTTARQFLVSPRGDANVLLESAAQNDPSIMFANERTIFTGMTKVPENISDVIVNRLSEISHVRAVLMGQSGDVYHVWSMIDDWSMHGRKAVYTAQKELLSKLGGFDLDFYVVPIESGTSPTELVSDIPVVFERAA